MSLLKAVIAAALLASASGRASGPKPAPSSTFDAVTAGRSCSQSTAEPGTMECQYRVGTSLQFTIAGVGLPDAGIAFDKSDRDGDYYAGFGLQHQCVIVWPGKATTDATPARVSDLAFVSPSDGKVYRDWAACARHAA